MTLDDIYNKVSESTGLSKVIVERTYKAYWRAIREHITSLSLKDHLTDEEFNALQPNVNIPSIGKLYVTLDRYKAIKKKYKNNIEKHDTHKKD